MIRTRFAPSPTGELHIGGARTALFSYLFAKHEDGEFFLRIEDTDLERYVEGSVERIIESLGWLGIVPDNAKSIMIQSDRLETYKKHAFDLVRAGKAYICTCSREKVAADRDKQEKAGQPPRYEGHCRTEKANLSDLAEGCYVIRLKMPEGGKIVIDDMIHGQVEFDAALLDDQIILKSDGYPTYHLASVVDDHETEITHVIRSDEWLSSTPKHKVLYEAFGWKIPEFAHLPMILGPDKKKLSKRHGATSVLEYKDQGYLPEAVVNFIAFLGWNPKDEREEFTLDELVNEFDIKNINKSAAVFNIEKLDHINSVYIKNNKEKIKNIIIDFGVDNISDGELELICRGGFSTLKEAANYLLNLRKEPEYDSNLLIFKKSDKEKTRKGLELAKTKIEEISDQQFDSEITATGGIPSKCGTIQQSLAEAVSEGELTNGDVFWPVRVALSGEEKSPSPVELAIALGKQKTFDRISKAIEKLK